MKITELKNISENDFFKDKVEIILEVLEENDIEKAYEATQLLINYINMDFLEKKYNIVNLKDSQMCNILKIYSVREKELFDKNNKINNVYLRVSERKPWKEDVIGLLYDAEYICRYKKEKYGI